MKELRFDQTTFEDLRAYELTNIIDAICDFMGTEIDKGNVIVIERRYSNAQPDIVSSIRNEEQLTEFRNKF